MPLLVYLSVGIEQNSFLVSKNKATVSLSVLIFIFIIITQWDVPLRLLNTKIGLVTVLCLLTPSFVIVYLLAAIKLYDSSVLFVCFLVCGSSTKLLYTSAAMSAYRRVGSNDWILSERYKNSIRRHHYVLKTIERAMFGPLQSLGGIEVAQSRNFESSDYVTDGLVTAMKATDMLKRGHEDVHLLSEMKNEEVLEMNYSPVEVKEFFSSFLLMHDTMSRNRFVTMSAHISPEVPDTVRCDSTRLYYALSILLQATLVHNPFGINIQISVTVEKCPLGKSNTACQEGAQSLSTFILSISVVDNGKITPCQDIERLIDKMHNMLDITNHFNDEVKTVQEEKGDNGTGFTTKYNTKFTRRNMIVKESVSVPLKSTTAIDCLRCEEGNEVPCELLDTCIPIGPPSQLFTSNFKNSGVAVNESELLPTVGLSELVVSFDIIRMLGGEISYDAGEGCGSVLRLLLPVSKVNRHGGSTQDGLGKCIECNKHDLQLNFLPAYHTEGFPEGAGVRALPKDPLHPLETDSNHMMSLQPLQYENFAVRRDYCDNRRLTAFAVVGNESTSSRRRGPARPTVLLLNCEYTFLCLNSSTRSLNTIMW